MIGKLILNWSLRQSEKEIAAFLAKFSNISTWEIGKVVGIAALFHHQYAAKDPEFEVLLNSKKGENQGPISIRVIETNRLVSEMHKSGRLDDAASMKLWNITFRCMTHGTLYRHGVSLWQVAAKAFPEAKKSLEARLEFANNAGHQRDIEALRRALQLHSFIPPQFREN